MTGWRAALGVGPVALASLFLVRAVTPMVDSTLLAIFVVLVVAVVGLIAGSRLGAGAVLLLALALFQPITARDFAFNLSSVDQSWWRWWAIGSLLALGWSIVASVVVLLGAVDRRRATGGTVVGLALGAALIPLFAAMSPQPGFGAGLSSEEISGLAVIETLNHRYEPAIVSLRSDEVYRAKVLNSSDLPHTITIDSIDLEVYVPPGRWSIIEIQGNDLSTGQLEMYCAIGDHRERGMTALLEVG